MALRLTGKPTTDDATGSTGGGADLRPGTGLALPPLSTGTSTASSGEAFGAGLRDRARLQLAANQLESYRELFHRAAEHEDSHARYHARVLLLQEGLAAASQTTSQKDAMRLFLTIAGAALDALEEETREPLLLNYAGVALYELWSLEAAEAMFKAAHRLEPSIPHLRNNLQEVARRRHGMRAGKPLHPAVPGLAAQARRLAPRAQPATDMKLSLCMIVRDEEEMLARCLAAVAPAVDEIVIVDTGSTDRTIEIAREFGANVIERQWTGSFSDARNASFEAATGDWIVYLDADEVLVAEDVDRLKALTGRVWREAFYLVETNYTGDIDDGGAVTVNALRVFRNRPHYRFEGRLHEQIAQHLPTYAGRLEQSSVRIDHFGYLGVVRDAKEKSLRNLELLRAQQAEGESSAFMHFNLGTEYSIIGDHGRALAELSRAWSLVEAGGEEDRDYVPALLQRLVTALRLSGAPEEAIARAREGLERFPGYTDLVFAQALASLSLGREDDAIGYWEQCLAMGDAPARYLSTSGAGTFLPRISLAQLYIRRGDIERARELLEWCIAEHPEFVGVVDPYATALLRSGVGPEEIVTRIEAELPSLPPAARFTLAGALYRHGAMAAAETEYRAVLRARPSSAQVRVQLAETLLGQRRYAEAAREAAGVPEDDGFAPLASRFELWGRIAAGELEAAHAARDRAARVGVPEAQLEVFVAWLALASGAEELPALPVVATPLLGVILETLLRAHDFEAFEKLTVLLERSALPPREQREVLATMYLAQGFLPSAAKEWMAVCESRPDARALLGLARVASAHGALADAGVFAAEALRHDPSSAAAREILARCSTATQAEPVVMRH
jgi:tetratricopeptide (TPR) repeat protein